MQLIPRQRAHFHNYTKCNNQNNLDLFELPPPLTRFAFWSFNLYIRSILGINVNIALPQYRSRRININKIGKNLTSYSMHAGISLIFPSRNALSGTQADLFLVGSQENGAQKKSKEGKMGDLPGFSSTNCQRLYLPLRRALLFSGKVLI